MAVLGYAVLGYTVLGQPESATPTPDGARAPLLTVGGPSVSFLLTNGAPLAPIIVEV